MTWNSKESNGLSFESNNKNYYYSQNDKFETIYDLASNVVDGERKDDSKFTTNLSKWIKFRQWAIWNPDLFFDLISPEKGGMSLDLDQRVFLRGMIRFISTYGVFPRG